jgi:adenylate kinase
MVTIKKENKFEKYKAILIFGPPGVGKGTQAKLLAESNEVFFHFSTGEMFRDLKKGSLAGSQIEKKVSTLIDNGNFVPDDLTVDLLYKTLESYKKTRGYDPKKQTLILDGIPRTPNQVDLINGRIEVLGIISLVVRDYGVLIQRIKSRAEKEGRPDDANEDTIRKRLGIYDSQTAAVLGKYSPSLIIEVDGLPTIEEIHKDIVSKLG